MFQHTSPLTLSFKVLVFPFVFLREMIDPSGNSGWGPDCANPVSANDRHYTGDLLHDQQSMLMFLFASVFGGLHFITWSFSMPTVTELWMWRSASIVLTSIPILTPLCMEGCSTLKRYPKFIAFPEALFAGLFLVLHPFIRLAVAVDSVVLLRSLPDTAFLAMSWSDAIPSF